VRIAPWHLNDQNGQAYLSKEVLRVAIFGADCQCVDGIDVVLSLAYRQGIRIPLSAFPNDAPSDHHI
jgi:hypothetical protein